MTIRIQAIKFEASQKLEEHITKKVSKLDRFFDEILSAEVILKVVKPEAVANKEALVKINIPGNEIFASKVCDTFEEAVDTAVDAIEKQVIRHKEKIKQPAN
ncbi:MULTISPECIES: ribosome hibernation-promoting factor, HPF/YfiA family [Paludibacter]|jgi:ribosomal subunit interface protein|uniref:Putative sigma-54 modulation protein n=1 Tax=Paludibacter jiangxiensis TaxID=681398 RepID=A0A171A6W1_9BACT|nr:MULTISPECIES: ribosome-associated translation inhibitor RaiA [Paludibacter]MDP4204222.1 ribosome-associated translation inhibitor RaiA [Bacteroidota bacterium]MTK54420.1 ribosome-associated translation inhibitor RaiA [Paludibacter sp.]GAT63342.1 putative sigma-54 modulation protein [Paludibacter jiangxiensis]